MTSAELERVALDLFGRQGWKSAFARAFNLNYATVKRWVTKSQGCTPVPKWVPPALELLRHTPRKHWPEPLRKFVRRPAASADRPG